MALRDSDYMALAALAGLAWAAISWWHYRHLRKQFEDLYAPMPMLPPIAEPILSAAMSFGCTLTLRACGVNKPIVALSQLALTAVAMTLAIRWQSTVYRTVNAHSVTIDPVAAAKALVAVTVTTAAFAPFVILNATQFSFSDGRYGPPIVLFAAGLLKLALISRSGKDRYRRARQGLRDS